MASRSQNVSELQSDPNFRPFPALALANAHCQNQHTLDYSKASNRSHISPTTRELNLNNKLPIKERLDDSDEDDQIVWDPRPR